MRVIAAFLVALGLVASLPVPGHAQETAPSGGDMTLADYERAQEPPGYNTDYFFALSRGLADSTLHPAAKVPCFVVTIPIDLALVPVAAIAGFFG